MSGGHGTSSLYVPGTSPLHRLAPQCKVAAAVLFVFSVVATPKEQLWAFGLYAGLLLVLTRVAGVRLPTLARRLVLEAPFVAFAVLLPFLAGGRQVDVGPLALSASGLWGAWNILAKGTLGLTTTVLLASTTDLPDLLRGLERLRVPRAFTQVAGFMIRYADVITGEMGRMRVARLSRGHDPRWIWQARAVAHAAGALFIRSYERGERVHLAMLSRGYDGALPRLHDAAAPGRQWVSALALPMTGALVASSAWALQ